MPTYLWDDGTQSLVSPTSSGFAAATQLYTVPGVYGVIVSVTDEDGNTGVAVNDNYSSRSATIKSHQWCRLSFSLFHHVVVCL